MNSNEVSETRSNYSSEEIEKFDRYYYRLKDLLRHCYNKAQFMAKLNEALADGFPIDYTSKYLEGETLLNFAIALPETEPYIDVLLDAGADVNIFAEGRGNSACCAIWSDHFHSPELFKKILKSTTETTELPDALCIAYMLCGRDRQDVFSMLTILYDAGIKSQPDAPWKSLVFNSSANATPKQKQEELLRFIAAYTELLNQLDWRDNTVLYDYEL